MQNPISVLHKLCFVLYSYRVEWLQKVDCPYFAGNFPGHQSWSYGGAHAAEHDLQRHGRRAALATLCLIHMGMRRRRGANAAACHSGYLRCEKQVWVVARFSFGQKRVATKTCADKENVRQRAPMCAAKHIFGRRENSAAHDFVLAGALFG